MSSDIIIYLGEDGVYCSRRGVRQRGNSRKGSSQSRCVNSHVPPTL